MARLTSDQLLRADPAALLDAADAWLEERAEEIATLTRRLADAEKRPCSHLAGVPEGSTVCWLTGNQVYVPVNPAEESGHDCDANGCQWGHVECIDLDAVCDGEDYVVPIIRRALASRGPDAGRGGK